MGREGILATASCASREERMCCTHSKTAIRRIWIGVNQEHKRYNDQYSTLVTFLPLWLRLEVYFLSSRQTRKEYRCELEFSHI